MIISLHSDNGLIELGGSLDSENVRGADGIETRSRVYTFHKFTKLRFERQMCRPDPYDFSLTPTIFRP